ncbi:N-acetylglucosamine kinase [Pedobacter sp. SYP-B3415]|uniref:N-acetylglucosamine kinase n=1 Tax=Pedobacter sp. SYP-B3415 TaxID=2496641 RepID=UPI00101E0E4D|nr:N-acetylglucosamine kinase [Pedobacter sp. SYP-B3415]
MILVADSGSSKTDWMAYTPEKTLHFSTQGINPYFLTEQDIFRIVSRNKEFEPYADLVKEIYFFGAGCSSPDKHEVVSNGLSAYFTKAFVSVEHDLMGSVYATCGDSEGLTCILGTGSNITYFDGTRLSDGRHGLGYILGDEGSGTYFGKKMLQGYFYKRMPGPLLKAFEETFAIKKEEVITSVYQKPFPNTYLAGFSRFMIKHYDHPFIRKTLRDGFQEFIDTNIRDYDGYDRMPVHFVGSISYYYREMLTETCNANGITVGKILQKPINELFAYILKRESIQV